MSKLDEPFFDSLRRAASEHTLAIFTQEADILPASLGADVNILGAVAQVLKGEL